MPPALERARRRRFAPRRTASARHRRLDRSRGRGHPPPFVALGSLPTPGTRSRRTRVRAERSRHAVWVTPVTARGRGVPLGRNGARGGGPLGVVARAGSPHRAIRARRDAQPEGNPRPQRASRTPTLLGPHQLDPGHRSPVPLPLPKLEDPRIAAVAFGETRTDLAEQFVDDVAVRDLLEDLAARRHVALLGERDQLLGHRANGLGLGLGRVDVLVDEQLRGDAVQHQTLVSGAGAQAGPLLGLGHPYSSRSPRPSSSSLALTSSIDFWPKLRMSISSASDFSTRSPTVLMPSRLRQLYERTDRLSSSTVIA